MVGFIDVEIRCCLKTNFGTRLISIVKVFSLTSNSTYIPFVRIEKSNYDERSFWVDGQTAFDVWVSGRSMQWDRLSSLLVTMVGIHYGRSDDLRVNRSC